MNDRLYFMTTDEHDNSIYIRRDDMLPFSFGGNKVIIAEAQLADMLGKGCNVMLCYGNSRSNLCRVMTNLCYSRKIPCKIISPLDDDDTFTPSFNNSFVKATGTEIITCKKSEAGRVIAETKKSLANQGFKPYFVYDIENVAAPVKAYCDEFNNISMNSDYIFLATGTGTTTAGLLSGLIKDKMSNPDRNTKIVGISVARTFEREMPVISSYIRTQGEAEGEYFEAHRDELFTLCDKYVGKGYGSVEKEVEKVIKQSLLLFGIQLDPTYTGKAFYGMKKYIEENNISGKKIIFWHTGGMPLFFDYFNSKIREKR